MEADGPATPKGPSIHREGWSGADFGLSCERPSWPALFQQAKGASPEDVLEGASSGSEPNGNGSGSKKIFEIVNRWSSLFEFGNGISSRSSRMFEKVLEVLEMP